MNFVQYWNMVCESDDGIPQDNPATAQAPVDVQPPAQEPQPQQSPQPEQKPDGDKQQEDAPTESIHFALAANIRNGLFKKDDSVYICQVGSTDQDGNKNSFVALKETEGDKTSWDNNSMEFMGYNPNEDNDWDYLEKFAKCGRNAQILKKVKDHYGNRFRNFTIMEYYPKEANEVFVDHIDPSMMEGLCPYCR